MLWDNHTVFFELLLDPFLGKVFNLTQMKTEDPQAEIYLQ